MNTQRRFSFRPAIFCIAQARSLGLRDTRNHITRLNQGLLEKVGINKNNFQGREHRNFGLRPG